MAIEFRCSQCSQLLRVPDDSAGKNARCPKCQALMLVPTTSVAEPPPVGAGAGAAPQEMGGMPPAASDPFAPLVVGGAGGTGGAPPSAPPPKHPFGEAPGSSPFGGPAGNINPYASPASAGMLPIGYQMMPINPRPVAADAVFNYAWEIWKNNLGLLIGITVLFIAGNYAIAIPFAVAQAVLEQQGEKEMGIAVYVLGQVINNVVQMYLNIGIVQIALKLARRQPASFADLFGGLPRLLPLIGMYLIAALPLLFGFLLLIVPGVLLMLAFWPAYYLIVDGRAGVIESFSIARRITEGNWGSAFVLYIMTIGITLLGCAAVCVGLLFALPLVSVMWATAYLMMSGQLMPYGPGHAELLGSKPVSYPAA